MNQVQKQAGLIVLTSSPEGRATTTSLQVSEVFSKQHAHVLRDIQNLECSKEFHQSNFGEMSYADSYGRPQKAYSITKDGFTYLAMGYTGKDAAIFKEAYIKAFNEMEQALSERAGMQDELTNAEFALMLGMNSGALRFEKSRNADRLKEGVHWYYKAGKSQKLLIWTKVGMALMAMLLGKGRRATTGRQAQDGQTLFGEDFIPNQNSLPVASVKLPSDVYDFLLTIDSKRTRFKAKRLFEETFHLGKNSEKGGLVK